MLKRTALLLTLTYFLWMPYMVFSQERDTVLLQFKSRWDNDKLRKKNSQSFNSLWGWTSPTGREYAIIGSLDSTYFIEVTDPKKPVLRDVQAGRHTDCEWREFKTYKNYCYATADGRPSSLQIFDLKYLPDSVHKVYDSDTLSTLAHTLFIDNDRLYLANNRIYRYKNNLPVSIDAYPLTILSLQNPEKPVLLGNLEPPIVDGEYIHGEAHDVFVRNDTVYCSNYNYGLFIYNYKDPQNPKLIASIRPPYPDNGTNHSSWLSSDGNTMVFADENHYKRLKVYDVSSLKTNKPDNLEFLSLFGSNENKGSIPHNPFIKGKLVFVSYYHDGVVVFDISDPEKPYKYANYDTYPQNDTMQDETKRYTFFEGCWNVYPFFPSGNIIASDMTNGLFVLRLDTVKIIPKPEYIFMLDNPFKTDIRLSVNSLHDDSWLFELVDMQGHIILSRKMLLPKGEQILEIPVNETISSGMYILKVGSKTNSSTFKLIHL